eukprot:5863810-Alexandrium_andersonii.AAC.1
MCGCEVCSAAWVLSLGGSNCSLYASHPPAHPSIGGLLAARGVLDEAASKCGPAPACSSPACLPPGP